MPVLPEASLGIVVLTRKSDIQATDCVIRHAAIKGRVPRTPDHRLARIAQYFGPTEMIIVAREKLRSPGYPQQFAADPNIRSHVRADLVKQFPGRPVHVTRPIPVCTSVRTLVQGI